MKESIQLFLIRHGNTFEASETPTQVGLRTDMPLTEQGRKQASQLGDYFKKEGIHPAAIYAGVLKRQKESAEIIEKMLNPHPKLILGEPALNEVDYGVWEGLVAEEISNKWPEQYRDWNEQAKWPKDLFIGDPQQMLENIRKWLQHLRSSYKQGQTVVGFTSNGIIRFFYSFINNEWEKLVQDRKMQDLRVKTGHLCELELFPDRLVVKKWNLKPS